MLGHVSSYNEKTGKGLVEDPNGNVYLFDVDSISDDSIPYKGMSVYFELTDTTRITNRIEAVSSVLPVFNWRALASIALVLFLSACALPKGDKGEPGDSIKGEQGQSGPPGQDGQSITGPQGPAGANGQDLANVHAVIFCPSQGSTTYSPNHFPEYGICIANKLYGVMDDSFHTWLAEIVPGSYNTTSTGLICNFTVLSNCVVQ